MKNFLLVIFSMLITYFLAPFYVAAVMSWVWLPIVFSLNNCFGSAGLGFVLGIVMSVVTEIIRQKILEKLSY